MTRIIKEPVRINFRFEGNDGRVIDDRDQVLHIVANSERPHHFIAPEEPGFMTPQPQTQMITPEQHPMIRFIYRRKNAATITLVYIDQHQRKISTQDIEPYTGETVDPTVVGRVPEGYHLNDDNRKSIVADSQPHTVIMHITGDEHVKAINLTLELKTPNGGVSDTLTHKIDKRLRTGDAYHVNPANYTPQGYHSDSDEITGYLGTQGLTKPDLTFEYTAMPAAPLTVYYVNQNQKQIGSYTYSGYMHQSVQTSGQQHVPAGYHLLDDSPRPMNLGPAIQNTTINVIGNHVDKHVLVTCIYKEPTGHINNNIDHQIDVSGQVGDIYTVDPNHWIKNGYHSVSSTASGKFENNNITLSHVTFKYEAGTAGPMHISYINQNGQRVAVRDADAYVDQVINIADVLKVPDGYHIKSGQKRLFRGKLEPQNINLDVQGEYQTNDFMLVAILKDSHGRKLKHLEKTFKIGGNVGDEYIVDPSKHPVNGYRCVSRPLKGKVLDHDLSDDSAQFYYQPQPITTYVDYMDAKNNNIKSVKVIGYRGQILDVGDQSPFTKRHMPEGYQYLEVSSNPDKVTMKLGMDNVQVKIAPLSPAQAKIWRSPVYPSFIINHDKWHYVKYNTQAWHQAELASRLNNMLCYHTMTQAQFRHQISAWLFMVNFMKIWNI